MKKIIVLGSKGMMGSMMFNYLKDKGYDVIGTDRIMFNAEELTKDEQMAFFTKHNPDIVINCIGIISQKLNIQDGLMQKLNAEFPQQLASIGTELGFKLIHISSDCAFDDTEYGRTKLAGEVRIDGHLTIRTSIIGPELKEDGIGLFHWFMKQSGYCNGFTKHAWNGVVTFQFAEMIEYLISKDFNGYSKTKLLDYRSSMSINKHKLLSTIAQKIGKYNVVIRPIDTDIVDKTVPPKESYDKQVLELTPYAEQIANLRKWMLAHADMYKHYGLQ